MTAALLAVWAALLLPIGVVLMSGHWIVLPKPSRDGGRLEAALTGMSVRAEGQWELTHVLYSECGCSQRICEYLLTSARPSGVLEQVLLIGTDEAFVQRATASGIAVVPISQEELESRFDIISAPLLLITDPHGNVVYAGGYTTRKQGPEYRDLAILEALRSGQRVDELPLYGCGVSLALQRTLDPLGIKYGQ